MTYSGLKSMIYAGLTKDDPRVKGRIGWIRKTTTWKAIRQGRCGALLLLRHLCQGPRRLGVDEIETPKGRSTTGAEISP